MAGNPIQFSSRTFESVLADINAVAELRGKPEWFKTLIAGVMDVLSRYNDAQANQAFLRTAFTRQAVIDKAELIDYDLRETKTSSGTQRFNIDPTASFPLNISASNLAAATESSVAVASLRFEARVDAAFSPSLETFTADDSTDELTVANTYDTGDLVRLTTTGTLPAGLSLATNLFVILIDATTIKLADSKNNANLGVAIDITDTGTGVHTITSFALKSTVFQQESISSVVIGRANAFDEWQEFNLLHEDAIRETIVIEIATVTWSSVTTFVDSLPTDKDYRVFYNTSNVASVRFGNGDLGEIPPTADVNATYAIGGGSASNVSVLGRVNLYVGQSGDVIDTDNITEMTQGQDRESIASAKRLAPALLKAFDNFVKSGDAEAIVLANGGVTKVGVFPLEFGLLSSGIKIIPTGGGSTTTEFKDDLQTLLIDKTILESIDVRVADAVYVVQNVDVDVLIAGGASFPTVESFVILASRLFFTEVAQEIVDIFEGDEPDGGIAAAVDFINNKFSNSFTATDFPQISTLIENLDPVDFGQTINELDFTSYIRSNVDNVTNVIVVTPSFPIVLNNSEVTQEGTVNVDQL